LDDYLDRELTAREMKLVQAHLEVCAFCAAEFAFEAGVLGGLRSTLRRIEAPADLLSRVRGSLARAAGRTHEQGRTAPRRGRRGEVAGTARPGGRTSPERPAHGGRESKRGPEQGARRSARKARIPKRRRP
jgi:hypothetical protein